MDAKQVPQILRRLQRAEGYIEIDLPDRALAELNSITDQGPFEPAIALLRGEAFKVQAHYSDAEESLKRAISLIPSPLNKRAWLSLAECYRHSGRLELAELADLVVNENVSIADSQPEVRVAFAPLPNGLKAFRAGTGEELS